MDAVSVEKVDNAYTVSIKDRERYEYCQGEIVEYM